MGKGAILVVGGTGMLGRPVAERLQADGYAVRVLSRDAARARATFGGEIAVVEGEVADTASLDQALKGCVAVHVSLRATTIAELERVEVEGTRAICSAAARAGVARLTYLSGAGIETADPSLLPVKTKRAAEAAIIESGLPYTIFRATHFMESLDLFVRGGSATVVGTQPRRFHYLAADDFAGQVSRALREPATANKALTLLGPEPFTMTEALQHYIALARPDLRLGSATLLPLRLLALLTGNERLRLLARLFAAFPRIPETGDRAEADRLVGRAWTTLDLWCRARAAAHSRS